MTSWIPRGRTGGRAPGMESTAVDSSTMSWPLSARSGRACTGGTTGRDASSASRRLCPLETCLSSTSSGSSTPEALLALDLTVWMDVPPEVARERGMRRDEELGRNHSRLWDGVWGPNELDFDRHFSPRGAAEVLYVA